MPTVAQCTGPPIPAGATAQYTAGLFDANMKPVPGSAFSSLQLTIADTLTGTIINNVNGVSILNVGRGTVDPQGNLTINLQTGDTALQYPAFPLVKRSLLIVGVYNGGASTLIHQANFLIAALLGGLGE